jgi:hypothetical protein
MNQPFRDLSRWENNEDYFDNAVLDEDGNPISIDTRKHPEPWSILYTVKTIYEHQMDGVLLNDQILRLFTRGGFITINNVDYSVEQLSAGLWGSQYKDFGRVEDGERKFQETYSYRVDILFEIAERSSVKTVLDVNVENVPQN